MAAGFSSFAMIKARETNQDPVAWVMVFRFLHKTKGRPSRPPVQAPKIRFATVLFGDRRQWQNDIREH